MRALLLKRQLTHHFREHVANLVVDDSGAEPTQFAIYTLSDPRDIRGVRYVERTRSPERRFLQHLNRARLWLPDEVPWWVQTLELRPLYHWIRELHRDEYRLPIMVVTVWCNTLSSARVAERALIYEHMSRHSPLLNVEAEVLDGQIPLSFENLYS